MEGLSWWQMLGGFLHIASDMVLQRLRCFRLPKLLPLKSLSHLNIIVTGATSGIGLETARQLTRAGAHVVLAVRNTATGQDLVQQWEKDQELRGGPKLRAEVMELNLLSLASVRTFAKQWLDKELPLHVLINNAGIYSMGVKQRFSEDGYEHHIQVNHLGHALLSLLLLPSLAHGAPSRIINLNSDMHHLGFVNPEDLNMTKGRFSSLRAYCGSKMAQLLFSRVLQMRIPKEAGIDVIIVHPGEVITHVTRDLPSVLRDHEWMTKVFRFSPSEGARSVLFCATDKQVYQYARDLREMGYPVAPYFSSYCRPANMARLSNDLEYATKVWNKTLELVALPKGYLDAALGNKAVANAHGET